jgi:PAS domain S-box-containing protein
VSDRDAHDGKDAPGAARPRKRRRQKPRRAADASAAQAEKPAAGERSRGRAAGLRSPASNDVLRAAVRLGRVVSEEMHEDEVVHAYVDALKNLFPGRLFAVRLFVPDTGDLTVVYATGRLRPDGRDAIELSREAIDRHGVDLARYGPKKASRSEQYVSLFQAGVEGFDVPIMDGERLIGILAVEYGKGARPPADDHQLIVQLSLQLGAALKNARLHRRSTSPRAFQSRFLDNANAPVIIVGEHGQVQFANRAFLLLTGFALEDLVGQDWLGLLPESERQRALPSYINALRGEATSNIEVKLPRRDGSAAQTAAITASVASDDGEIESVVYIFRDTSGENPAALRQLVAGVVHELNNPLTNISVYGEYLLKKNQEEKADPGDVEKLRRIVANSVRIRNFTRDLVAYARPSNEKPTLTRINEIIDQAVMYCEHLIDETGATVEKRYDDSLPRVYGVKSQLVQVFVNLVTNACHAMPTDAGLLVLETAPDGDSTLCVRVIDSGSGIPEDNLDKVFEPFFTTKGQGKGTGLGLSIIKNIIEQHRGSIAVKSEVGSGTTFELILACRPESKSDG